MMDSVLIHAEVVIAVFVIIGTLHSVWRGLIHEMVVNIRRIRHIDDKQDDMADAIVALSHSTVKDGVEVDPEALERDLRDEDKGPSRYVREERLYRGGKEGPVEDEHEDCAGGEQRHIRLGEEVDEPE